LWDSPALPFTTRPPRNFAVFAGQIYAPQKIKLIDVPEPKLDAPDQIIFQPELGCLCGSDLLYYENDYPEYPSELGHSLHELIGTVLDTNGKKFKVGDRVLCVPVNQRGLYERFAVTEQRAIPLIEEPTPPEALMAQPLGTVIYALRKLPNLIDLNVVVVGQGPIGQLFNLAVNNLGAREVIALDKVDGRLATSPKTGATRTINVTTEDPVAAVREITGGKMADLVIEAVGHREQALNLCIDLAKRDGTILYFGVPQARIDDVAWRGAMVKNLKIQTSINPDFAIDFPLAMRWINERRVDVSPIITHRYGVEQIQDAFDLFFERREGSLKVLIDFPAGRR
jgi:threonine dehydrogenase-like Zn-dependent dehydrogenase